MHLHIQEAQQTPNRINSETTPRCITVKLPTENPESSKDSNSSHTRDLGKVTANLSPEPRRSKAAGTHSQSTGRERMPKKEPTSGKTILSKMKAKVNYSQV